MYVHVRSRCATTSANVRSAVQVISRVEALDETVAELKQMMISQAEAIQAISKRLGASTASSVLQSFMPNSAAVGGKFRRMSSDGASNGSANGASNSASNGEAAPQLQRRARTVKNVLTAVKPDGQQGQDLRC